MSGQYVEIMADDGSIRFEDVDPTLPLLSECEARQYVEDHWPGCELVRVGVDCGD